MIIIRNKKTGLVLGIDGVRELAPISHPKEFMVSVHDVDYRFHMIPLAKLLENYEFVKEVL